MFADFDILREAFRVFQGGVAATSILKFSFFLTRLSFLSFSLSGVLIILEAFLGRGDMYSFSIFFSARNLKF